MLGAEMDQEAGTALIKYNFESAPFPWVFGCLGFGYLPGNLGFPLLFTK